MKEKEEKARNLLKKSTLETLLMSDDRTGRAAMADVSASMRLRLGSRSIRIV